MNARIKTNDRWILLMVIPGLLLFGISSLVSANSDLPGSIQDSNYPAAIDALPWNKVTKLMADGGDVYGDGFGESLAMSGDTLVVGAKFDDDNGADSGAVYIFERDQNGNSAWGQVVKLTAADGEAEDFFGGSVAIDGDTVAVKASGDDDGGEDGGAVYIFERNQGGMDNWGQIAKLTFERPSPRISCIAIEGDTVVVSRRTALVFERNQGGMNNWGQVAELRVLGDEYSPLYSVAISGDTVIAGAPYDLFYGIGYAGAAYVFVKPEGGWSGTMDHSAKLRPSDTTVDEFGISVSISGDVIVVGEPYNTENGVLGGAAYVFVKPESGWGGEINESAKLRPSDGVQREHLGQSVSISGDTIVAGAPYDDNGTYPGSVYAFTKPENGWSGTLNESAKLLAFDSRPRDEFGDSVSMDQETVVVGAHPDDFYGPVVGSVYVFENVHMYITQSASAAQVNSGDLLTYTLRLYGPGINAAFKDPLPAEVRYMPGSLTPPASYDPASHSVIWQGLLPLGRPQTFQFQVQMAVSGTSVLTTLLPIVNTVWLTDVENNDSVWGSVSVDLLPRLAFDNPPAGTALNYDDVLDWSVGFSGSGEEIQLYAALPIGVQYVPGSLTGTLSSTAQYDPGEQAITWQGTLDGVQSLSFQLGPDLIYARVLSAPLPVTTTLWITYVESELVAFDSVSVDLQPIPLSLSKQANPNADLHNGDTLTFTLMLSGRGLHARLYDPLPPNLNYVPGTLTSVPNLSGTLEIPVYSPTAKAIIWQGRLPTDTYQVIQFQTTLAGAGSGSLDLDGPIINTAWLTATESGRVVSATALLNGYQFYLPFVSKSDK